MSKIWKAIIYCCIVSMSLGKVEHNYCWKEFMGTVPTDAFSPAENLYIAQIFNQWLMPGTFNATSKEAYTEQGDKLTVTRNFKLLCDVHSDNFYWEQVNIMDLVGSALNDLVVGGWELGATMYIGRIFHDNEWKIGKIYAPLHLFQGLRVWNKKDRYVVSNFEVLKYRSRYNIDEICSNQCVANTV